MVGSSNLVWTLYQVVKGWDSNRDGLSTPTTTLIGIRGPSKSRFCKNLSTADRKYSAAAHNLLEKSYKGGKDPKEL